MLRTIAAPTSARSVRHFKSKREVAPRLLARSDSADGAVRETMVFVGDRKIVVRGDESVMPGLPTLPTYADLVASLQILGRD